MPGVQRDEARRILAEKLRVIDHLEQSEATFCVTTTHAIPINDHSFAHPTTCAVTRTQNDGHYVNIVQLSMMKEKGIELSGQSVSVHNEVAQRQNDIKVLGHELDKLATRISASTLNEQELLDKSGGDAITQIAAEGFFRPALMSGWDEVKKLQKCLMIHTEHAAQYHLFYNELHHRSRCLEKFRNTTEERINKLRLYTKPDEGQQFISVMKDVIQALGFHATRAHQLRNKSTTIVPVHLRNHPTRHPQPGTTLVKYNTRDTELGKDEDVIVEDTNHHVHWRIRNRRGHTAMVPALIILLPGPDHQAMGAVRQLMSRLVNVWNWTMKYLGSVLIELLRRLLQYWNDHKVTYDTLDQSQKDLLLKILTHSKSLLGTLWSGTKVYKDLSKLIDEAQNFIKKANTTTNPVNVSADDVKIFGDEIVLYAELTHYYQDFESMWKQFRSERPTDDNDEEWNVTTDEMLEFIGRVFLEEVVEVEETVEKEEGAMMNAMVEDEAIFHETVETEGVVRSEQQQQEKFVISSITDPRNGTELDLDEALELGILDMEQGLYINPDTKESKIIPEAMSEGLIQVTLQSSQLSEEKVSNFGLIRLTKVRETRPYTITGVVDPKTDKKISLSQAQKQGIISSDKTEYHDTEMDIKMSIMDAVDVGLVTVEFDKSHKEETETEVKTYAVYAVVDTKSKKRLTFAEAVNKGVLDKDSGLFVNTATQQEMFVGDAIQCGLVKARKVDDNTSINIDPKNTMVVEKAEKAWNKLKAIRALGNLKK